MGKKSSSRRPGRGSKGLNNPILKPEDQGKKFAVKSFIVQPEITIYDANGLEERKYLGPQFAMYQAQTGDPVPVFMEKLGVKLNGGQ